MISGHKYRLLVVCILFGISFLQIQCSTSRNTDLKINRSWKAGEVYEDENGWVEVHAGNIPLVISVPHGGEVKPKNVPDRECSGIVTVRDGDVIELALKIEEELTTTEEVQPYLIIGNIARTKIDFNRDIERATCGNEEVKGTWHEYHDNIKKALADAADKFDKVLFIDIHGHGHKKQRLELGYALKKVEVKDNYIDPDGTSDLVSKSSLYNLLRLKDQESGNYLKKSLTGETAFGTLMENEGVTAVPSKQDPYPLKEDKYFTGGYITREYTSSQYPRVFGWQVETNYKGIRDNKMSIKKFGESFTKAIMRYMDENMSDLSF